jgi:hypothetical protein
LTKKPRRLSARSEGPGVEYALTGSLASNFHGVPRATRDEALGRSLWVRSAEDAVVTKLRWASAPGRQKDVSDARGILAMSGDSLNLAHIRAWCEQHDTLPVLDALLDELGLS